MASANQTLGGYKFAPLVASLYPSVNSIATVLYILCFISAMCAVFSVCFVIFHFLLLLSFPFVFPIFSCPADNVPDWQSRILLRMVEARSVKYRTVVTVVLNLYQHGLGAFAQYGTYQLLSFLVSNEE